MSNDQLTKELSVFKRIWNGGYFEGNPLDPLAPSTYGRLGYISILHAVYLGCIRPYVDKDTVALEFGPGRGAWTKALLGAREVWALDAKSRQDNGIDDFLGNPENLVYHHVADFGCSELPDDHFDYVFSFGCFCHVSWDGISQYAKNMFPKLKSGAECFWMVADYEQRNRVSESFEKFDIVSRVLTPRLKKVLEGSITRF